MTIFRIKTDDKPSILKTIKDPEVVKLNKEWGDRFGKFEQELATIQALADMVIDASRKVYTKVDTKLKDKTLSKEERDDLLALRKKSYNMTVTLKKIA